MPTRITRNCQRLRLLTLFLAIPLGACTSSRRRVLGPSDATAGSRGIVLHVRNNHALDMRVYLVREGLRVLLGSVGSLGERRFRVPIEYVGLQGQFQLEADPLGSVPGYRSELISTAPGDRVDWTVGHRLWLSTHVVRPRGG